MTCAPQHQLVTVANFAVFIVVDGVLGAVTRTSLNQVHQTDYPAPQRGQSCESLRGVAGARSIYEPSVYCLARIPLRLEVSRTRLTTQSRDGDTSN